MSDGMNKVILLGRLGDEPTLRLAGPNKTSVLAMRLATTESWIDKDDQVRERTAWHSVVVFGPRAEAMSRKLVKGSLVFVEGYLSTSSYEKDGVKRWKTEVVARDLQPIPDRARSLDALDVRTAEAAPAADALAPSGKNGSPKASVSLHDDIPF